MMRGSATQRGTVMVAALLFAVTILAFATSIITSGVAVETQKRSYIAAARAQDAAESGVHRVLAELGTSARAALLAAGVTEGVLQGTGPGALRYRVTIEEAGGDGIDNDVDGLVDEADEADMVELASTGTVDNVQRTVRVTLLARYRQPEMPSAVFLADPNASVRFNGNSFLVSGHDQDLNGNPTGLVVPGIGVAGDPTYVRDSLGNTQHDNVIGEGGVLSVYEVDPMDMQALVEEGARSANILLDGGTHAGEWGTIEAPAIVYAPDGIHISGGASGAGILIVNGTLTITGAFEWRGLIIVRGEVRFAGGGGGKRLTGGLVVEDAVVEDVIVDESSGITLSGTIDILFSEQTLTRVSTNFATYTILNWREGPNPPEVSP